MCFESFLRPAPNRIFEKIKKEGMPDIDLNILPEKSKSLYLYLLGSTGRKFGISLYEYEIGKRYPFVREPMLFLRLFPRISKNENININEIIELLKKANFSLIFALWEIVLGDFSIDKIKLILKYQDIIPKFNVFAKYLPYFENMEIMDKFIMEVKELIKDCLIDMNTVVESFLKYVEEKHLLKMWKNFKKIEWEYFFPQFYFSKEKIEITPYYLKYPEWILYFSGMKKKKHAEHFSKFLDKLKKRERKRFRKRVWCTELVELYLNFPFSKIEDILYGAISFPESILLEELLPVADVFKNLKFKRRYPVRVWEIACVFSSLDWEYILENFKEALYFHLYNIESLLEKLINLPRNLIKKLCYRLYYRTLPAPYATLFAFLLSNKDKHIYPDLWIRLSLRENPFIESWVVDVIKRLSSFSLFFEYLSKSAMVSPDKTIYLFLNFLNLFRFLGGEVEKRFSEFIEKIKEDVKYQGIRAKEEIEKEIKFLENKREKDARVIKRIENLKNMLEKYEEYKEKMEKKMEKRVSKSFPYIFINEFEKFLNGIYLETLNKRIGIEVPVNIDENWQRAILLYLNLKCNKRAYRKVLFHLAKGDYREWVISLPVNREFIKELESKGIKVSYIIDGYLKKIKIKGLPYIIYIEKNPFEIIRVGEYFKTCLSISEGSNYGLIPYLIDLNKLVIYLRNREGKVVARARVDISREGIIRFQRVYSHIKSKRIERIFVNFIKELAKKMNTKLGETGNFKSLHNLKEASEELP